MIRAIIECDICGKQQPEAAPGEGYPGWGAVHGAALDGVPNPNLCPEHLGAVMTLVDRMKNEEKAHGVD